MQLVRLKKSQTEEADNRLNQRDIKIFDKKNKEGTNAQNKLIKDYIISHIIKR